jgi:hypothetical protein
LDALIVAAGAEAEQSSGVSRVWLAAQYGPQLRAAAGPASPAPRWTRQEDDFLRQHLGRLPIEAIAARLGRTPVAVTLRWKRDLALPAPSKHPDILTAHLVAYALGVDGHALIKLIDRGLLPGRILPGQRNIRVVRRVALARWAVNPDHWPYFLGSVRDTNRIRDGHLRRLIERQKGRWPDEWWTAGQVARYHGLANSNPVNRYIHTGRLVGLKWGNWFIKRSAATAPDLRFFSGKGSAAAAGYEQRWSDDLDAFLLLAAAMGCRPGATTKMTGRFSGQQIHHRLHVLRHSDRLPLLLARPELAGVQYNSTAGLLLADWRQHQARFPALTRSITRFTRGDDRPADIPQVIGVLRVWADWYADPADPDQQQLVKNLTHAANATPAYARAAYRELRQWDIDPLETDN